MDRPQSVYQLDVVDWILMEICGMMQTFSARAFSNLC